MFDHHKELFAKLRATQTPVKFDFDRAKVETRHRPRSSSNAQHPRAGKLWSDIELQDLVRFFLMGGSLQRLSKDFGRSESAIAEMLRNLGVLDKLDLQSTWSDYVLTISRDKLKRLNLYCDEYDWVHVRPTLEVDYSSLEARSIANWSQHMAKSDDEKLDALRVAFSFRQVGRSEIQRLLDNCPNLQQVPKEPKMATDIKITTQHFIGGVDAKTMTDAQIFALIAKKEAEVEGLNKIKTSSKKLDAAKAEAEADIAALAKFVDER